MDRRTTNQWFRLVHKWAGLSAALWLIVLGSTGFVLDHPEWRGPNQITVPERWGSPDLTRFIRVTFMRQILVDPEDDALWLGGSERGLWSSDDGGDSWQAVEFDGLDYSPQVYALGMHPESGFERAVVGTDDGIWIMSPRGVATAWSLRGRSIRSISSGSVPGHLVGVADRSDIFTLATATGDIVWSGMKPIVPVISDAVTLNRYVLNTHFGHGLAEGRLGVLINDYSGIAMVILGISGFFFWYTRGRWKASSARTSPAKKRQVTAWLYRSHAPIIGTLAIIPILYVSITGIFGDHIRAIYEWTESVTVPSYLVPAGFSMRSLDDDIQDIVVNPANPEEWLIATRKGLYVSADRGESWRRDNTLPIQKADYGNSLNLFRVRDTLFVGAGLNASYHSHDGGDSWSAVEGPFTGISSGAYSDGAWHLKNSQGVFSGDVGAAMAQASVNPPPLEGMPLFLFLADIHTGHAIAPWFPWVNDFFAILAIVLVVSGPVIWWRKKWI